MLKPLVLQQIAFLQNESDVTRAEMASALAEVVTGKIPNDRIALKVLWEEMVNWPALDVDRDKKQEKKGSVRNQTNLTETCFCQNQPRRQDGDRVKHGRLLDATHPRRLNRSKTCFQNGWDTVTSIFSPPCP